MVRSKLHGKGNFPLLLLSPSGKGWMKGFCVRVKPESGNFRESNTWHILNAQKKKKVSMNESRKNPERYHGESVNFFSHYLPQLPKARLSLA